MPTCFTIELCNNDQSFSDFVLGCAKAFGAFIEQRDDPINSLFKPTPTSTYAVESLERAKIKFDGLASMTDSMKIIFGSTRKKDEIIYYTDIINKNLKISVRINAMLDKVNSWEPPTADHNKLKEFMISQLTDTLGYDGKVDPYIKELRIAEQKDELSYYNEELVNASKDVEYYSDMISKEVNQNTDRNAWITELYQSIADVDPSITLRLLKEL
jgi:hypothetical protein